MKWNCRGLENKIHEILLFLKKANIDIVCSNEEVKKWQKRFVNEKYFIVTEAKASSFHGSNIIAKRGNETNYFQKKSKGPAEEIIVLHLETLIIGHL